MPPAPAHLLLPLLVLPGATAQPAAVTTCASALVACGLSAACLGCLNDVQDSLLSLNPGAVDAIVQAVDAEVCGGALSPLQSLGLCVGVEAADIAPLCYIFTDCTDMSGIMWDDDNGYYYSADDDVDDGFDGLGGACTQCIVPHPAMLGDGWCDSDAAVSGSPCYNTRACGYDGGDCCPETCSAGAEHVCGGAAGYACRDPSVLGPPDGTTWKPTGAPSPAPSLAPTADDGSAIWYAVALPLGALTIVGLGVGYYVWASDARRRPSPGAPRRNDGVREVVADEVTGIFEKSNPFENFEPIAYTAPSGMVGMTRTNWTMPQQQGGTAQESGSGAPAAGVRGRYAPLAGTTTDGHHEFALPARRRPAPEGRRLSRPMLPAGSRRMPAVDGRRRPPDSDSETTASSSSSGFEKMGTV